MTDTVFWSWQDDLPSKSNREFIRDCLADAVKQVSDALDVEDMKRINLDHDTKGAPGMVDISQTILEKIRACTVMVADVTPIAETTHGKSLPNPNVMVELGYAMSSIGFGRIIAILNTANGGEVEKLPFDIRNRRILTYALATGATRDERRKAKETLIKDLTGAIKTNISKVRSESVIDHIEGANSDAKSVGLWQANWPIGLEHSGSCGTQPKVIPFPAHRAWLRVIPDGFSHGMPKVSACAQLPDDIRLVPPRGLICGRADSGPCEFGFLTYWILSEEEDGSRQASNLAAFLQETGEIWMSDGEAFYGRNNVRQLNYDSLLYNWGRGFKNAMVCLNALGASKHRRVIVGIEGLRNTFWERRKSYRDSPLSKAEMVHEATKREWSVEDQTAFLMEAWNKLLNVFSLNAMIADDFAQYYEDLTERIPEVRTGRDDQMSFRR